MRRACRCAWCARPDDRGAPLRDGAGGAARALARARGRTGNGLTVAQLSEGLRTDPLQIEPLIDVAGVARLGRAGSTKKGAQRHVLLCDPKTTVATPLIDRLLLVPEPATLAFRRQAGLGGLRLAELIDA